MCLRFRLNQQWAPRSNCVLEISCYKTTSSLHVTATHDHMMHAANCSEMLCPCSLPQKLHLPNHQKPSSQFSQQRLCPPADAPLGGIRVSTSCQPVSSWLWSWSGMKTAGLLWSWCPRLRYTNLHYGGFLAGWVWRQIKRHWATDVSPHRPTALCDSRFLTTMTSLRSPSLWAPSERRSTTVNIRQQVRNKTMNY